MLDPGKKLQERYRIERHVGQGGMGSVYLATDERFHSTVAIKEALFADDKYRKAFAREARLLNSLKHSALPKVTDHFVEDNGQYIVMEFIGGDDLFETMRKSGRPFPVEDVLSWSGQLLDALSYLHEQGIIHRDIKPQNLKLTPQGNIILLDFGLAKGNPTDANYQTAAQSIFGYSRNYASLEQIQGTGTDPRSDVYSLAATIYHLMTARVPADALTRVMKVLNENTDPLEPAGLFNPKITQEVSDALDRCLELKSDSRPKSVDEMRELLFVESKSKFAVASGRDTAAAAGDDMLTRGTELMDDTSGSPGRRQSDVKTEILAEAGSDSVRTMYADGETIANAEPRKTLDSPSRPSWSLAVLGVVLLAVVGLVAATVAFWPVAPENVPAVESENTSEIDGSNANPSVDTETQGTFELTGAEPSPKDTQDDSKAKTGTTVKKENSVSKDSETASTSKGKAKAVKDKTAPSDSVVITDSRIEADGVVITPGKVEVRPTPPPLRSPPAGLPISREQFDKLTPRQKRLLRRRIEQERLRRNRQNPAVQRTASPPPPRPPQ